MSRISDTKCNNFMATNRWVMMTWVHHKTAVVKHWQASGVVYTDRVDWVTTNSMELMNHPKTGHCGKAPCSLRVV